MKDQVRYFGAWTGPMSTVSAVAMVAVKLWLVSFVESELLEFSCLHL